MLNIDKYTNLFSKFLTHRRCETFVVVGEPLRGFYHVIFIYSLLIPISCFSQEIGLEQAQNRALEKYALLAAQKLDESYYRKLAEIKRDLPKATIGSELGQFNSRVFDTKVQVAQSFSLPALYRNQQKLYEKQAEKAQIEQKITEKEVKIRVKQVFYEYQILKEKEKVLFSADSLFRVYASKASLRKAEGEASGLEKVDAELQLAQTQMAMLNLQSQIEQNLQTFNYLLHTENAVPTLSPSKIADVPRQNLSENPQLLAFEKQMAVLEQEKNLEKSQTLPEITIGYANQSIIGYQGDTFFRGWHRFQVLTLGVAIPISKTASNKRIEAAQIQVEQQRVLQSAKEKELQHRFELLLREKEKLKTILDLYAKTLMPNAELVYDVAEKQIKAGEITYLEWVVLMKEHIQIHQDYLEHIQKFNDTVIEMEGI